jgi:transposase-like protein
MEKRLSSPEKRGGLVHWDAKAARAALAELAASGESVVVFARRTAVSPQRLFYWKKRLREDREGPAPTFVAVALPVQNTETAYLEIVMAGIAVRVREGLDVEHVANLVEALARRTRGC